MGRRSTNTTKSGKYMNPTDQARKEARKKELKKNKKQRKLVRETVLKLKDPIQILDEMLRLDLLEIEGLGADSVNEKVVADKKKKLLETLNRILGLYEKSDKEKFDEIKKYQVDCDQKRHKAYTAYQSQRMKEEEEEKKKREAEEATFNLSEVALPHSGNLAPHEIPLPNPMMPNMPGIKPPEMLSSSESNIPQIPGLPPGLIPPGPPPGLPPPPSPEYEPEDYQMYPGGHEVDEIAELEKLEHEFQDMEHSGSSKRYSKDDDEYYHDDDDPEKKKRKVHFADEKSDNNEDEDGEEDDDIEMTMQKRLLKLAGHDPNQRGVGDRPMPPPLSAPPGPPPGVPSRGMPPGPPPGAPPGLPPGPPPGMPPRPPPGLPPNMRLPPRMPPPGMPLPPNMRPAFMGPGAPAMVYGQRAPIPQNIIEKGPEIKKFPEKGDSSTISAKPQIRNIRAELTKFVPTAVKIHRNPTTSKGKVRTKPTTVDQMDVEPVKRHTVEPTKDDIYAKFMNEMDGFL